MSIYGGKYYGLKILENDFSLKVPFGVYLNIEDIKNIYSLYLDDRIILDEKISLFINRYLLGFEDIYSSYIIRSSSCLEGFNGDNLELSGVYKSKVVNSYNSIFEGIISVLKYNESDHISYIHDKYNYEYGIFIPIIIQPLFIGDYSGVLVLEGSSLYIEYSRSNNFSITDGTGVDIFKIETNINNIPNNIDKVFIKLINDSRKIYSKYSNFSLEFSLKGNDVTYLQFKNITSISIIEDYSNIYLGILNLMESLGFGLDDFAIVENDTFLFFNYLGVRQTKIKDIEHIRILIINNKFKDFFYVKEGSSDYISPRDTVYQDIVLKFYVDFGLNILFVLNNDNSIYYNRKIFVGNGLFEINFFMEDMDNGSCNKEEITFFLNRVNSGNYYSILRSFIDKLESYKKIIYGYSFSKSIKNILLKNMKQILIYINILYKNKYLVNYKLENTLYIHGEVLFYNKTDLDLLFLVRYDFINIEKSYNHNKIAFVCNDFEPSWLPYLKYISLVIILRPFKGSHGVAICREFNKALIYNTKGTNNIKNLDYIKVDFNTGIINKVF